MSMMTNIKRFRKALDLTQLELAKKVGVSQTYICQLETGNEQNPTKGVIESLAAALGVTVGKLIGEGGEDAEAIGSNGGSRVKKSVDG